MSHDFSGRLIWADFHGVCAATLNHPGMLMQIAETAASLAHMKVHSTSYYKFMPQGIDVFVSLLESSIVIHTYPEHEACFIDIFTCGRGDPIRALEHFVNELKPRKYFYGEISRGGRANL